MNTSDNPGSESTAPQKDPAGSLMTLYFSIILITFVAIMVISLLKGNLELETREKLLDAVWIIIASSQLLIPFTVKEKKRRMLAFVLCIAVVIMMLGIHFGLFNL